MMKTFQLITVYLWLLSVTRVAKLCYLIRSKELQVCKTNNCTAVYARLFKLCWLINCDWFQKFVNKWSQFIKYRFVCKLLIWYSESKFLPDHISDRVFSKTCMQDLIAF